MDYKGVIGVINGLLIEFNPFDPFNLFDLFIKRVKQVESYYPFNKRIVFELSIFLEYTRLILPQTRPIASPNKTERGSLGFPFL